MWPLLWSSQRISDGQGEGGGGGVEDSALLFGSLTCIRHGLTAPYLLEAGVFKVFFVNTFLARELLNID